MATNYTDMLEELKDAYANLLIIQYHDKPKAKALVRGLVEIYLYGMTKWKIRDCWDIDDTTLCVGTQLDIIGKWVGVDRYYQGQNFGDSLHLSFIDWDKISEPTANQGGLRDWNNTRTTDGDFLTFDNVMSITNKLNDNDFRILIKLKIIKNNTIMSCKNIDDAINNLLSNNVQTLWKRPMELTYNINDNRLYAIIDLANKKNCLPIPTGCKIILSSSKTINGGSSNSIYESIIDGGQANSIYTSEYIINGGNA